VGVKMKGEVDIERELKIFVFYALLIVWIQTLVAYVLSSSTSLLEIDLIISVVATLLLYAGFRMLKILM
jgi:hypothetical protein